jgi:hypothetical protein
LHGEQPASDAEPKSADHNESIRLTIDVTTIRLRELDAGDAGECSRRKLSRLVFR